MSPIAVYVWTIFAWGIAAAWVAIISIFARAILTQKSITHVAVESQNAELPRLSVVVAAKNEEECIETCLRSLFRQDYPGLEVVAVNDRSTDRTGEILDRLESEFTGRLHVVHVKSLPSGWFGKPHALTLGVQAATGSLICFTDADCEFLRPDGFRMAVAELAHRQLDFISVAAKYTMDSLRESVAVPCCAEAVLLWLHPERADDPTWDEAFANGSFMMTNRQSFERIGGWGAVRSQICEDLQLMRLAKRSGCRVGIANADGIYQTASYPTWRDSWNGWSRIFKGVLTPNQLMLTLVRMSVLFVLPFLTVLQGLWQAMVLGTSSGLTEGAGLALTIAFCLRSALDVAMFYVVRAPLAAVPLAPLGRLYAMAAMTRALLSHAGLVSTHWRGASFVGGQMVTQRPVKAESHIPLIPTSPVAARR